MRRPTVPVLTGGGGWLARSPVFSFASAGDSVPVVPDDGTASPGWAKPRRRVAHDRCEVNAVTIYGSDIYTEPDG